MTPSPPSYSRTKRYHNNHNSSNATPVLPTWSYGVCHRPEKPNKRRRRCDSSDCTNIILENILSRTATSSSTLPYCYNNNDSNNTPIAALLPSNEYSKPQILAPPSSYDVSPPPPSFLVGQMPSCGSLMELVPTKEDDDDDEVDVMNTEVGVGKRSDENFLMGSYDVGLDLLDLDDESLNESDDLDEDDRDNDGYEGDDDAPLLVAAAATATTTIQASTNAVLEVSLKNAATTTTDDDEGTTTAIVEERNLLVDVISDAPAQDLGQLTLASRLDWSMPLPVVTRVLRKAHQLTSLHLFSIAFQGDQDDFDEFVTVLRQHSSLKEIHLVDCSLVDQSIPIDALLRALAAIPTLETVEIYAMDLERQSPLSLMSPESLADLCRSPTITTLSLEDLDLGDDHIKEVSAALKHNNVLKNLTLWDCNITDKGGQMIADMLQTNKRLEKVDLSFNGLRDPSYKAIATALRTNQTLWSLSLHGNNNSHPSCDAKGKKKNRGAADSGWKYYRQKQHRGSGYEALLKAIREDNHIVEEMILEAPVEDPRVSLYLTINRNRHLFQDENVTKQQLIQCLAQHNENIIKKSEDEGGNASPKNDDYKGIDEEEEDTKNDNRDEQLRSLSFVFYLLQTNPQLFCE